MGMFDDFRCSFRLPIEAANALDYQTKDTPSQFLDKYELREDGTLWVQLKEYVGEIRFYTMYGLDGEKMVNSTQRDGWIEWSAYFKDGQLQQLNLIENRKP